jgi:uncharacterized protein involved in outer membrane biogenesis
VFTLFAVLGAGVAVSQTSWFKNWLRQKAVSQAAQYLNGELTIRRLSGNIFTGVALEGVALRHEGQTAVAMDRLTVHYSPLTVWSQGVMLDSMTLENPTLVLQRDAAGWNFNRFVKTRRNTGGRGAPPIAMESVAIKNGHVILKDRGALVEDLTRLNTTFRFAYEKPGISVSIKEMSAVAVDTNVRSLVGNLRFDRGTIVARDLAIETDRSKLTTMVSYLGPSERTLDIQLNAERLSLPEIGRYFKPLANIRLEPAVTVTARGTLDALSMNVDVASSAGSARGPLVGHFGNGSKSLEGRLDVRDVNMQPILNRDEWKTRVTGEAISSGRSVRRKSTSRSAGLTSRVLVTRRLPSGRRACTSRHYSVSMPAVPRMAPTPPQRRHSGSQRRRVRSPTASRARSAISICAACPNGCRCQSLRRRQPETTSSSRSGETGEAAASSTNRSWKGRGSSRARCWRSNHAIAS